MNKENFSIATPIGVVALIMTILLGLVLFGSNMFAVALFTVCVVVASYILTFEFNKNSEE